MTEVLIAGGGTVGLATAVFLGRQGVTAQVVDRRAAPSEHPRALGLSPRTLEFFREAGLREQIDAIAVRSAAPWKADTRTVAEIDWSKAPKPGARLWSSVSPEVGVGHYPQHRIDSVLLPAARELGVTVEYGVGVTGLEQDADGVSVTLSDGRVRRVDYVVGADGARSTVREAAGIGTTGPGELGELTTNILFRADLTGRFGEVPTMVEILHPEVQGILLAVGGNEWALHTRSEDAEGSIRRALGVDDVEVEVVSALRWRPTMRLADRLREGRVLLVGDAARASTPLGAFGLNSGLADAHNLAWKLAMVARGEAGDGLLDSYHEERHAVARLVTEQAGLRWARPELHWNPDASAERRAVGMWNAPLVTMGFRYDSSAIAGPVAPLPSTEDLAAVLDGSPGTRLCHRWLRRDGAQVSTVDLNESGFAVLTGPEGEDWQQAAAKLGVRAVRIGVDVEDLDGGWAASVGIEAGGALLIRPDGFVAWRTPGGSPDPVAELDGVLARVVSLAPEAVLQG